MVVKAPAVLESGHASVPLKGRTHGSALSPAMIRRVDVTGATLAGAAAAGRGIALLYLIVKHAARDFTPEAHMQPYFVAAPFLGALVGYLTGHERWQEAAYPAEPAAP